MNRREFAGAVGLAAAGVATGALLPSLALSLPTPSLPTALVPEKMAPYAKTGPLADWSIDDMTGDAPRYAEPIGHRQFHSFATAESNPLDSIFLV